jgi:hypothetical protein
MRPRKWRWRVFHVPKGVSYAIENSQWGTRIAYRLGFRWIDKDGHITKDGVRVLGHWGLIAKNQFVLPKWFVAKYGKRPRVKDVLWADLAELRTVKMSFHGPKRTFRFATLKAGMQLIAQLDMGIMIEQKGDEGWRLRTTWAGVRADAAAVGLRKYAMASLSTMTGARKAFAAAHEESVPTIVMPRGRIPITWKPNIDYYKSVWFGWNRNK